jgi:8-oxo-dGTP pyrophosphatase MutT (NUDIX family)
MMLVSGKEHSFSECVMGTKVDAYFVSAKINPGIDGSDHLLHACKIGAARELFEETGIDLRSSLDRLNPVHVRASNESEKDKLSNEFKKRVFFSVDISDDDLFTKVSLNVPACLCLLLRHASFFAGSWIYQSNE